VTIRRIGGIVGREIPVARAMPNMPALIGMGFTAIAFSDNIDPRRSAFAKRVFRSVGDVVEVDEKKLDAMTAISGSGPAYFFFMVETLIRAGIRLGLPRDVATDAVLKTALGSAEILARRKEGALQLRKKVTSKGGTTEAAFGVFRKKGMAEIIEQGVAAAFERSKELSGG
jgi:pyrroline-5-carboxylate reductase